MQAIFPTSPFGGHGHAAVGSFHSMHHKPLKTMIRFRRTANNSNNNNSHQPTTKRNIFSRHSNSNSDHPLGHPPLSQFDACIEACDALAASSSRQTSALVTECEEGRAADGVEKDSTESIAECSVLVSPDGALLFTSKSSDEPYQWTKSSSHPTTGHDFEEYESAILTGNDLTSGGDYDSNGFSARGWDANATSNALKATHSVLKCMEAFVEGVALCEKEKSTVMATCCGQWSDGLEKVRLHHSPKLEMGGSRVGPLLAEGSSLNKALIQMEQYYRMCAEASSERWREACCDENHRTCSESFSFHKSFLDQQSDVNSKDVGVKNNRTIVNSLIQGLIPRMKLANNKAEGRIRERDLALNDTRTKVAEAQGVLMKQKEWSSIHWQRVKEENKTIDQIVNQQVREQTALMQKLREQNDAARLEQDESENAVSDHDIWEMVRDVGAMEEFEHTGLSPRSLRKIPSLNDGIEYDRSDGTHPAANPLSPAQLQQVPNISRAAIEEESDIHELRKAAVEADDLVEDAAGALLNIMSKQDTTMRSARVAGESALLSECNAAHRCLRSLVEIERAALQERIERLHILEQAVDAVDTRKDIDAYIQHDKSLPGGLSTNDDDGGIASALAVLNSHSDEFLEVKTNITRPNFFKGWSDAGEDDDDEEEMEPDFFKAVIQALFQHRPSAKEAADKATKQTKLQGALTNLSTTLSESGHQGRTSRQAVLYELNNQRSINTELEDETNFASLCNLFDSFLSGCGRDAIDVANAKMLMILSQTFFFVDHGEDKSDRTTRVYVKMRISSHEIWGDDDFW
jgi:hypothetical protein